MNKIADFIPHYREINSIVSTAVNNGALSFAEQRTLTEFYNAEKDVKAFEKIVLDVLMNVGDNKSYLLLSNLKTEVEKNISLYESAKDRLEAIDIRSLCGAVASRYDEDIKHQSEVTAEYRRELNKVNGSLEAIGFREHTKEEELLLERDHARLTALYREEKQKLDQLYNEKEKLERETAKYNKNLFGDICELSRAYLSILSNYLSDLRENKTQEIKPIVKEGVYFDMSLIAPIHKACNNIQFENLTEVDFYALLNLQPTNALLTAKTGERTRICYLIHKLYEYLKTDNRVDWRNAMLKTLDIKESLYKSKYKEAAAALKGSKSYKFVEQIDDIFE